MDWIGLGDTARITVTSTNTTYAAKIFNLAKYQAIRVSLCLNDTSTTGAASDSIHVVLKYRTFHYCYNYAGAVDTCYNPGIVVDTIVYGSLHTMTEGKITSILDTSLNAWYTPARANKLVIPWDARGTR